MALLDASHTVYHDKQNPRDTFCTGSGGSSTGSDNRGTGFAAETTPESSERDSRRTSDMKTSGLTNSTSGSSLAPPPGLPHNGSTAELVALGIIETDAPEEAAAPENLESSTDGANYDPRPPILASNSTTSGGGSMSGTLGGGGSGVEAAVGAGGMSGGTGSAGGMGLGLKNHSLTNLANMVRSQSVSNFRSDLFGMTARGLTPDGPSWGSYPANLDKAAGPDPFSLSPAAGSAGAGVSIGNSRGIGMRSSVMRSSTSSGDTGAVELSPPQFAGRGTNPRREVERGPPAWRRSAGASSMSGSTGTRSSASVAPGGRAMVHNRSDTDLVASFARLDFGHGGQTRWSPHMSPTASPLGAPLLEEDPLDLELEGTSPSGRSNVLKGQAGEDLFGPGASMRHLDRRSLANAGGSDTGGRLPRHASYPSLALSRGGGFGMDNLVHDAFEDLSAGDRATTNVATDAGGVPAAGSGGLSSSGVSSGKLSSAGRANGRTAAGGSMSSGSVGSGPGASVGNNAGTMSKSAARGGGFTPTSAQSAGSTLSPAHTHSPCTSSQRAGQGMGPVSSEAARGAHDPRHRPGHHVTGGAAGVQGVRGPPEAYDHTRSGGMGMGGVDGAMMNDGRFVPAPFMGDAGMGAGHPSMSYNDGYPQGVDRMGAGQGGMEVPWGVSQDHVSLYQALLMKQSLAAAHASDMRFPGMLPAANGMGINMMDMAALAAAVQQRGGFGVGGFNGGGYPGMGMDMKGGYGRREGGHRGGMGPRGGMDMGYMNHVGGMDPRGMMGGMGRVGGMYDIPEDVGDGNVYQVQFKRATRNFLLGKTCQRDLQVGDYVKVEADRGEDLGMVVQIFPIPEAGRPLPATAGQKRGFGQFEKEHIIRAATEDEVQMVRDKLRDEERVLEVCRNKVLQRSLPMTVMDAEFQYDRHKLTFFFKAEGRIDFRELVRDLFSLYKTRIWMQQLEPDTAASTSPMGAPYSPQNAGHMAGPQSGVPMDGNMGMGGPML